MSVGESLLVLVQILLLIQSKKQMEGDVPDLFLETAQLKKAARELKRSSALYLQPHHLRVAELGREMDWRSVTCSSQQVTPRDVA